MKEEGREEYFEKLKETPVTEAEVEELKMDLLSVIMNIEGLEGYKPPWWQKEKKP